MDSHGHENGGSGTLQTDTEAPQSAVLISTAEALRKSQEAFRHLLAELELPQTGALSISDLSPETYCFPDITGWFSEAEALHLYTTIKLVHPKSILEIGTFYGRSTATICAAIRSMKSTTRFITIDLDLHSEQQVQSTFGEIHGTGSVTMPAECKIAFNLGLSSTEYAKHQLNRYRMTQFVEFKIGDFRSLPGKFDVVFADVLHERNEIERNLADILIRIVPGGILAAHDVSDENKSVIERLAPKAEFISRCETLGIYRIGTDDH